MADPIPLPVCPRPRLRACGVYISPVPDHPEQYSWACQACLSSDIATGADDLGRQLARHVMDCPG